MPKLLEKTFSNQLLGMRVYMTLQVLMKMELEQ